MALPDFTKRQQGTAKTWLATGGDYAITLTSLASNAGRGGVKGDLGETWARQWAVLFTSAVASAATNGLEVELYWGPSHDPDAADSNPGNLTGSDAAVSNPDELKSQCVYIGSLVLSNARGTNVQKQWLTFFPPTRYGIPFVVNKSGQALGSTATDHSLTFVPVEELVQDAV